MYFNWRAIWIEAVSHTAKKKEIWVRVKGKLNCMESAKRIYGSFQDIDERKEPNKVQSLADNLPGVVFQYQIYPDGTDSLIRM